MDLHFRLGQTNGGGEPGALARPSRHELPLSAQALSAAFDELKEVAWPAAEQASVRRIGQLLAHEAQLAQRLGGLPGTEHPAHWARQGRQRAERSGRLWVRHLPLWWTLPLTLPQASRLNVALPLADSREELLALALEGLPRGWRRSPEVAVRLELHTRVYWGARAGADARWQACSVRGDALSSTREMFVLDHAQPSGDTLGDDDLTPQLQRHLRGGIGLLVAVPVLTLERPGRSLLGQLRYGWDGLLRRLGRHPHGDRDPTFAERASSDEAWWAQALGHAPLPPRLLRRGATQGGLLRPANGLAQQALAAPAGATRGAAGPTEPPVCHVVLIHGGLSSARSAFADALTAQPAPGTALWPGLPALEQGVAVWRFEHDSFRPLSANIAVLHQSLTSILSTSKGRLLLLTHSRGGSVARFALAVLRQAAPLWQVQALTLAGPHLGTQVFRRIGQRYSGLAGALGLMRDLAGGLLGREQMAELVNIERALAYEVPTGFKDVEPESTARLAGGDARHLPPGMVLVGSEWGPPGDEGLDEVLWDAVVEDLAGAEPGGDGLVARHSAWGGRTPGARLSDEGLDIIDASPAFHTRYLAHAATRAAVQQRLHAWATAL